MYKSDAMEVEYFAKIDADADIVHQKLLIDKRPPLLGHERRAWARFINSLLERSPQRIAEIERLSAVDPKIQNLLRHPVATNLRDGPLKADLDAMLRNNLLRALRDFIDRDEDLTYLSSMKWVAFDLTSPDAHFLTSDCPIVLNAGSGPEPIEMLTIAISPKRLLIMHREHEAFDQELLVKAAIVHSWLVTQQAQRHLVSSRRLVDGDSMNYARIAEHLAGKTDGI